MTSIVILHTNQYVLRTLGFVWRLWQRIYELLLILEGIHKTPLLYLHLDVVRRLRQITYYFHCFPRKPYNPLNDVKIVGACGRSRIILLFSIVITSIVFCVHSD